MDQRRKSRDKEADAARKTKLRAKYARRAPAPSAVWDGRFFWGRRGRWHRVAAC